MSITFSPPASWAPYATAAAVIFAGALFVNALAVPNMLSHDQLHYEVIRLKVQQPDLFIRDPLFADTSYQRHYIPFLDLLARVNRSTGGSENSYRLFVPLAFFVFTFGMFLFLYAQGISLAISIGVAFLSTVFIRVLMDYFGIPGPSDIVPRFLALPLYPYLFLLFYRYAARAWFPLVFVAVGLLATVHQLSALNVAMIMAIAYVLRYGVTMKTARSGALFVVCALIGAAPFIVWQALRFSPASITLADEAYRLSLYIAHPHLTPAGMFAVYREYFLTHWYYVWPLAAVFMAVMVLQKKEKKPEIAGQRTASMAIVAAAAMVTFATTAINQFVLLVLEKKTLFVYEPRAFQFAYLPLYLALGYLLQWLWDRRGTVAERRVLLFAALIPAVVAAAAFGSNRVIKIAALIRQGREAATGESCRLPLYGWLVANTKPDDLFLIDPDGYPHLRVCAKRSVVYTYRDSVSSIRTNYLVEWARRKELVERAYRSGPEAVRALGKEFGADYLISRTCLPVPDAPLVYKDATFKEDCVFKLI